MCVSTGTYMITLTRCSSNMLSLRPAFTLQSYHNQLNLLGKGPAGMQVCFFGGHTELKASFNLTKKRLNRQQETLNP